MIDEDTCTFTEPPAIFGDSFKEQVQELLSKNRQRLEERQPVDRRRKTLTAASLRFRLLALETGFDQRTGQVRRKLLQPWINPRAMGLLTRIGRAEDGAWTINDLDNLRDLDAIAEMQDRNIAYVGEHGVIHLLSQPEKGSTEKYPGATRREINDAAAIDRWIRVPDDELTPAGRAAKGLAPLMRLGDAGPALVVQAVRNLQAMPRDEASVHTDGIGLTVREICTEANRIRSGRADLDGYKWLHVETCRLIVNKLLEDGEFTEVERPRKQYLNNEWITHPRVYAVLDGVIVAAPLVPIVRRRGRMGMAA
jgi:hypothetical protein